MKTIRIYIVILIVVPMLISCDYESGMNLGDEQYKTNLFHFNTKDSTYHFIAEGYNPIFLSNSNRILYRNRSLWLYNIENGKSIEIIENFYSNLEENSISPDEQYLIYRNMNDLLRINLASLEIVTLIKSLGILNPYPIPKYSNDGKQIIYTSSPKQKK